MKNINTDSAYTRLHTDRAQLAEALGKVTQRIVQIETALRVPLTLDEHDQLHVDAALSFAESGHVQAAAGITALQEEHVALRRQREALERSLAAKDRAIAERVSELSLAACAEREKEHKALALRAAELLRKLDGVYEAEFALRAEIESNGYSARFADHVASPVMGLLRDPHSQITTLVRELEAYAGA